MGAVYFSITYSPRKLLKDIPIYTIIMPYLKLRISLDISDNVIFNPEDPFHKASFFSHLILIKKFIREKEITNVSCGFEDKNKYGEPCRPHFHVHFYFNNPDLVDPKRTLVNYLKSRAEAMDIQLKHNKKWCLSAVEEPEDLDRFYRYPFKFGSTAPMFPRGNIIKPDDLFSDKDTQIAIAVDENKRRIDANCLHREKSREKASFKDKLFTHLNESPVKQQHIVVGGSIQFPSHQDIWIEILNYYISQDKPINMQTIDGYTTLYQLYIGALTPLQAYVMRSNGPQ